MKLIQCLWSVDLGVTRITKGSASLPMSHYNTSSLLLHALHIKPVTSQWLLRVFKHSPASIRCASLQEPSLSFSHWNPFFQAKICTPALHGPKSLPFPTMGTSGLFSLPSVSRKMMATTTFRSYRHVGWWHQYFLFTSSPPKFKIIFATKFHLQKPDGGLECDVARCLIPFQMSNDLPSVDKRLENQRKVQKSENVETLG